jgi:hypothetical protein
MALAFTRIGIAIVSLFPDPYDDSERGTAFLPFVLDSRSCAKAGVKMPTL